MHRCVPRRRPLECARVRMTYLDTQRQRLAAGDARSRRHAAARAVTRRRIPTHSHSVVHQGAPCSTDSSFPARRTPAKVPCLAAFDRPATILAARAGFVPCGGARGGNAMAPPFRLWERNYRVSGISGVPATFNAISTMPGKPSARSPRQIGRASNASSPEVTMERFRKFLACFVCVVVAGVSGAGLAACGDMNSGGQSSSSGGSASGGGY